MPDYRTMYFRLFNKVTVAIGILQEAQREGEEAYISSKETPLVLLNNNDEKKNSGKPDDK